MDDYRTARILVSVTRAKREILADIRQGLVPATVATFAELHDYVDANEYGDLTGWLFSDEEEGWTDADVADMNAVQNTLDTWIKAGRPTA